MGTETHIIEEIIKEAITDHINDGSLEAWGRAYLYGAEMEKRISKAPNYTDYVELATKIAVNYADDNKIPFEDLFSKW